MVAHLYPFVRAQVRQRLGERASNTADLDDLVEDVWVIALRKVEALSPRGGRYAPAFVRFLSTTATNVCNNFLRKSIRRRERGTGAPSDSSEGASPLYGLEAQTRGAITRVFQSDVRRAIDAALEEMSEENRELLVMRLLEQRSNQELADRKGVPANTVAVRYRRALDQLRDALPREIFDGIESFASDG